MSDSGTIVCILETLHEYDIPRLTLQRRRLSILGILASGYEVIAACHGTRFRFTAVLYPRDTTHLVFFEHEVEGQWGPVSINLEDTSGIRAFCGQFVGFLTSVIATAPAVPQMPFGVNLDEESTMHVVHTLTEYLARQWQATRTVERRHDVMAYTLTLPPQKIT